MDPPLPTLPTSPPAARPRPRPRPRKIVVDFGRWLESRLYRGDVVVAGSHAAAARALAAGRPLAVFEGPLTDVRRADVLLGVYNASDADEAAFAISVRTDRAPALSDEACSARTAAARIAPRGIVAPVDARYPLPLLHYRDSIRIKAAGAQSLRGVFCVFREGLAEALARARPWMGGSCWQAATEHEGGNGAVAFPDVLEWLHDLRPEM